MRSNSNDRRSRCWGMKVLALPSAGTTLSLHVNCWHMKVAAHPSPGTAKCLHIQMLAALHCQVLAHSSFPTCKNWHMKDRAHARSWGTQMLSSDTFKCLHIRGLAHTQVLADSPSEGGAFPMAAAVVPRYSPWTLGERGCMNYSLLPLSHDLVNHVGMSDSCWLTPP